MLRAHDQLHGLVMQFHHVVMDGWGTSVVMKRWSELYNLLESRTAPGPRDGPGYQRYIEESDQYLASDACERDAP